MSVAPKIPNKKKDNLNKKLNIVMVGLNIATVGYLVCGLQLSLNHAMFLRLIFESYLKVTIFIFYYFIFKSSRQFRLVLQPNILLFSKFSRNKQQKQVLAMYNIKTCLKTMFSVDINRIRFLLSIIKHFIISSSLVMVQELLFTFT